MLSPRGPVEQVSPVVDVSAPVFLPGQLPQRRNSTVWPGQLETPPSSTGRASTPAAARTLAAIAARGPVLQIVTTGLLPSTLRPIARRTRYGTCLVPGM